MITIEAYHLAAALFFARIFLGILFLFQGYDKLFRIGVKNVIETSMYEFSAFSEAHAARLPRFIFVLTAYFTSYVEFFGGILLILGFMKSYALYFLGIDLVLVALAMSSIKPLWDMQYVFPRLLLVLLLLIVPFSSDIFSIDFLLSK